MKFAVEALENSDDDDDEGTRVGIIVTLGEKVGFDVATPYMSSDCSSFLIEPVTSFLSSIKYLRRRCRRYHSANIHISKINNNKLTPTAIPIV